MNSEGWTTQRQSLLNAEQSYSGTSHGEHEYSGWEPRITGVNNNGEDVVEVAYDNDYSDSGEHLEAWTVANAGATADENVNSQSDSESHVFEGGFAGECQGVQRWQYEPFEGDWRCAAGLDIDVPALLPNTDKNDAISLIISPTLLWEGGELNDNNIDPELNTFPDAIAGLEDEWGSLDSYEAECWPGNLDEKDEMQSNQVYERSGNTDMDNPFGFYIKLGENHDGVFACSWEFVDSNDRTLFGDRADVIRLDISDSSVAEDHREQFEGFNEIHDGVENATELGNIADDMGLVEP